MENFLAFLDIWTTPAESAPGVPNTLTVTKARWAAGGTAVLVFLVAPAIYEKTGAPRLL